MSDLISSIKHLRELTGVGYLDCKEALKENNNDVEKSIDFLRKKGLAKASKKSSREVNEGAIGIYLNDTSAIMIEINTETDFAAKNEVFLDFLDQIGEYALKVDNISNISIDDFLNKIFDGRKISEYFLNIIEKIGENIVLRRLSVINKDSKSEIYTYTHNAYRQNVGKICVMLKAEVNEGNDETNQFGKNLCMHIAASKPLALETKGLDASFVEKEKEIQKATIKSYGKPDNIVEKILEGKMNKFYSEVTLFNQPYIFDLDKTVGTAVSEFSSKNYFNISQFELFVLGFYDHKK